MQELPLLSPTYSLSDPPGYSKGHVCHVRVNKRPVIPTCFVSVTLSAGRSHSALFKWACLQSVKSTAAIRNGRAGVTGELCHCLLCFAMLSAPRLVNGRTLATLLSIAKQPTGTHRKSISPILLFDMLQVNCTYPDTLSLWLNYRVYCSVGRGRQPNWERILKPCQWT